MMAELRDLAVLCPECGVEIPVAINVTVDLPDTDGGPQTLSLDVDSFDVEAHRLTHNLDPFREPS